MDEQDQWRFADFSKRAYPDDPTGTGDPDFTRSNIPAFEPNSLDPLGAGGRFGAWIIILVSIVFVVIGAVSW
ncbi:hypothetical protein [Erythrobacter colymbi]|uniref:hypothetical protein n=1 Tax=Erythrobacter colymbi TaxID=1161202 RepID=UPI00118066D1|nr:hypothetical protein [Erythrobacter colymbi]